MAECFDSMLATCAGEVARELARGALGNPWLFARLLGERGSEPTPEEVRAELSWTIDRAVEHLGEPRACRYLRKFYPWYLPRLGLGREATRELQEALQSAETVDQARRLLSLEQRPEALAV